MFKTAEGSTGRLLQLCFGYFFFYVITGLTVKYFQGAPAAGLPGMKDFEFLVYSTTASMLIPTTFVLIARWYKMQSIRKVRFAGLNIPIEFFYIIPSGICTGVVIPTTTIMYSLPISVMVAMIIMRGAVIIISRAVDTIQISQGILKKKVYWEENVAVLFAVLAIAMHILWAKEGDFDFVHNNIAMITLISYIVAYSFRIYIMNYYKNTTGKGAKHDNKAFFAVEQLAAFVFVWATAAFIIFYAPEVLGWNIKQVMDMRAAILTPHPLWFWAMLASTAYGIVAFLSVFIFMFKGRTATFAGLVNRLTSLVAGTAATLLSWIFFAGKFPKTADWLSLGFILIAVAFLTKGEKKRAAELIATREIEVPQEQNIPAAARTASA